MNKQYQVVALIGKAGAGKDSIQTDTCNTHPELFHKIVSCTTRPSRDNEKDGEDYHFLSVPDFTRKVLNGEMLEATEFREWFYGTSIDSLVEDKINIGVFNPAGVEALLQARNIDVTVIWVDTSNKTRLLRYLNRSQNPDCAEMCRRFFADEEDFSDIDFDYYWLINDDGDCTDLLDRYDISLVLKRAWHQLGGDAQIFETAREAIKAESNNDKDNND